MPANQVHILIIEDELQIRRFLRATLSAHNYTLTEAGTAADGLQAMATQAHDLIILDLGLPDLDGLEVTRHLREWSTVPIIVLSARGQEQDKIAALDAGADDYLTKPFGVGELLARIRVALRHRLQAGRDAEQSVVNLGAIRIDLLHRQVFTHDSEIHLTPNEYKLLALLAHHAGKVVTQKQLLHEVWGPGYENETHYLRVYMGQLRHKLEENPARPRYLTTEPGVGYRLKLLDDN